MKSDRECFMKGNSRARGPWSGGRGSRRAWSAQRLSRSFALPVWRFVSEARYPRASANCNRLLQGPQHVFDDVAVDDLAADVGQLLHGGDICLLAIKAAVAAGRKINAELLLG